MDVIKVESIGMLSFMMIFSIIFQVYGLKTLMAASSSICWAIFLIIARTSAAKIQWSRSELLGEEKNRVWYMLSLSGGSGFLFGKSKISYFYSALSFYNFKSTSS